jgi:nucleoside-diphosphate-sugar epimerase
MDAIVYLAMGKDEKGDVYVSVPAYDVNVKGVHLACEAALRSGVKRFIYMSTLSIYDDDGRRRFDSEEEPPDSSTVYGLTKFMGEEVCRFFSRVYGLDCIALRLNYPAQQEQYAEICRRNPACGATSGPDLARAVLCALACEHSGFDAVFIAGDPEGRRFNIAKAKRVLGWEPSERP